MKPFLQLLLIAAFTTGVSLAQAQTTTKPKPKTGTTLKTVSVKSDTKATKTSTTGVQKNKSVKTTSTRPTVTQPAAKPAARPPAPTPVPAPTSPALEIPGVAPQKAPSFAKGTVAINLGLGIGLGYGYDRNFTGSSKKSSPAISLSAEKGIVEGIGPGVISVGGLLGYKSDSYTKADYKAKWTNVYVAARGAYHYNFTTDPKLDTYAGMSLAVRIEKYSNDFTGSPLGEPYTKANVEGGIFLGGRYLFTDKIGAFAELGYDMSYLKIGVTTKF